MVAPISSISFTLNGDQVQLTDVSPHLTLLEWLRAQPGLTGTKKMCGEGGCGCCVVSVVRKDPATGKDSTIAINSVRLEASNFSVKYNCILYVCSVYAPYIQSMDGSSKLWKELEGIRLYRA